MIPKMTLLISFCVMVIAFVMTAACISPLETNLATNPGKNQVTNVKMTQPTYNSIEKVSFTPDAGYASHFIGTALLGRPTDKSVNINLVSRENLEIFAEYKSRTGNSFSRTPSIIAQAGVPENIVISGLKPDTGYTYHICYRRPGETAVQYSPEYSFQTQRMPGSSFVFDVSADSHLDERSSEDLYQSTLNNELSDKPDFLIDLGDTFMNDKLPEKTNQTFLNQYLRQRSFFGTIGHSVPLFLVLGNHDGEAGYAMDGTGKNIAVVSSLFRKMYFPDPEPNDFYTGNSDNVKFTGLKQDYYSWEWGDALFVVLDPYWYTMTKPGGTTDGWGWTLGDAQYQWLKQTLEESPAKYKFVFSHHLVGGDMQGRGGTEFASLYEWGGYNDDGSWGFDQNRPGWGVPIHQMLVKNNVTAFFHGHDHLFAKQELDGVIYQEVPQPATMSSPDAYPGAEYGYVNGEMLGSPGHLRINVSPDQVIVDYIGSCLPGDKRCGQENNAVVYSYTITQPGNTPSTTPVLKKQPSVTRTKGPVLSPVVSSFTKSPEKKPKKGKE